MTDDSQLESGQFEETQAKPTSAVSSSDVSSPSFDVNAIAEALIKHPKVLEEFGKIAQSTKDKRFSKLENKVGSFEEQLAQYQTWRGQGKSDEEAKLLMKMQDLLQDKQAEPSDAKIPEKREVGSQPEPAISDLTHSVLKQFGLNPNEPDVLKVLKEQQDFTGQMAAFSALADKRKEQQKVVGKPSGIAPVNTTGVSPESLDPEAITRQELVDLMNDPLASSRAIADKRKELEKYIK